MQGRVLDYFDETDDGLILGTDEKRYTFNQYDWKARIKPRQGLHVDFETDGELARRIYLVDSATTEGSKNKLTAGLLAIFVGSFGVHKFYLGFTGPGLVFLLINTVGWAVTWLLMGIPNILLGVIALTEGIIYLTKSDEDFERSYVIEKKQWF
ncbi:MAG: TM2 domain-containing protein [Firmicutes bacterium]|nr:TM2 domain-containing protein [Bacillota bacterium]